MNARKARKRNFEQASSHNFDDNILKWNESGIRKANITENKSHKKKKNKTKGENIENEHKANEKLHIQDNLSVPALKWETPKQHKRHKSELTSSIFSKRALFEDDDNDFLNLSWAGEFLEKENKFSSPSIVSPNKEKCNNIDKSYFTPSQQRLQHFWLYNSNGMKSKFLRQLIFKESKCGGCVVIVNLN